MIVYAKGKKNAWGDEVVPAAAMQYYEPYSHDLNLLENKIGGGGL